MWENDDDNSDKFKVVHTGRSVSATIWLILSNSILQVILFSFPEVVLYSCKEDSTGLCCGVSGPAECVHIVLGKVTFALTAVIRQESLTLSPGEHPGDFL